PVHYASCRKPRRKFPATNFLFLPTQHSTWCGTAFHCARFWARPVPQPLTMNGASRPPPRARPRPRPPTPCLDVFEDEEDDENEDELGSWARCACAKAKGGSP